MCYVPVLHAGRADLVLSVGERVSGLESTGFFAIGGDEGSRVPSTALFRLVCLSGYVQLLAHLLLGNIGVFPDAWRVFMGLYV